MSNEETREGAITEITHTIRICTICRGEVEDTRKLFICPFCSTTYHTSHLAKWLQRRKYCPICRNELQGYYIGITLNRKTNGSKTLFTNQSKYFPSTRIARPRTRTINNRRRNISSFQRVDSENRKHEKELRLIGGLIVFWIILFINNPDLFIFGSFVVIPLLLYFLWRRLKYVWKVEHPEIGIIRTEDLSS